LNQLCEQVCFKYYNPLNNKCLRVMALVAASKKDGPKEIELNDGFGDSHRMAALGQ
jgi:hypothetical protein